MIEMKKASKNYCSFAVCTNEARAQQNAWLLIWKLKQGQIGRGQVMSELDSIADSEHKERVRFYLNKYRVKNG